MYRWCEHEIRFKRYLCRLLGVSDVYYDHYTSILNQIDITKKTFRPEEVLVSRDEANIDYKTAFSMFSTGLECIDQDVYSSLIDIYFQYIAYVSYGEKPDLQRMHLSDHDLIDIVHGMIANIGIIEYDKIYRQIKSARRHILNLQDTYSESESQDLNGLRGITFKDPLFKKSYINVFRADTVEDIEVLFHETMHAIYYNLLFDKTKGRKTILHELEGQMGSLYTYDYLEYIGLKKDGKLLRRDFIENLFLSIHLLVLNHALHATAENGDFNLAEAESMIKESLVGKDISISPEELPSIINYYGYENISTIIASLVALEIMSKDAYVQDKFLLLHQIKEDDSEDLVGNMQKHDVDFRKDSFKTLRKVHSEVQSN